MNNIEMFEMAFFYGDYSMLPTSDELFENDEYTTTEEWFFLLEVTFQICYNYYLERENPKLNKLTQSTAVGMNFV